MTLQFNRDCYLAANSDVRTAASDRYNAAELKESWAVGDKRNTDGFTGLRGYAALWVMFFHTCGIIIPIIGVVNPINKLSNLIHFDISPVFTGWGGVEILFVLSGFLLFRPFADNLLNHTKPIPLGDYFRRRLLRILPAYYVQIAILGYLSFHGYYEYQPLSNWIAHLFMVHNFSPAWSGNINGAWWTLPAEFNFYLLLPLLFLLIRRINIGAFFIGAVLFAMAYRVILLPFIVGETVGYKAYMFGQIMGKIDLFAYGMLGAFIYSKYGNIIAGKYKKVVEVCLIATGVMGMWVILLKLKSIGEIYWNGGVFLYVFDPLFGFFILLLVLGITLNGKLTKSLFCNKPILFMGDISYGIYLWHFPVLRLIFDNKQILDKVHGFHNLANMTLALAAFLVMTFVLAILSYKYIELPAMRLGKQGAARLAKRVAAFASPLPA